MGMWMGRGGLRESGSGHGSGSGRSSGSEREARARVEGYSPNGRPKLGLYHVVAVLSGSDVLAGEQMRMGCSAIGRLIEGGASHRNASQDLPQRIRRRPLFVPLHHQ